MKGKFYVGDCLTVMGCFPDKSIDLIYIDPPFNTGKKRVAEGGEFNDKFDSRTAYLNFMKLRIMEFHRVLKDTGSFYLHCDCRTSHYLKVMLDNIFGDSNFINDLVWCYSGNGSKNRWGRKHDNILFYAKTKKYNFNVALRGKENKEKNFNKVDENGRRYWEWVVDKRVYWDEYEGRGTHDWWSEIPSLGTASQSKERTGYPTQKPKALLERIIKASSNENDVVLDAFCGSGTTCEVANNLGRRWLGIDVSDNAIRIAERRINGSNSTTTG